jgi:fluoride exporter
LTGYLLNMQAHPYIRPALVVGFCGGFTTFSTFSIETVAMVNGGEAGLAALYVLASVVMGIAGAAVGFMLVRPAA